MKSYKVTVDGKVFNVDVQEVGNGSSSKASVANPTPAAEEKASVEVVQGGTEVTAPMPGVILGIKANVGDQVKSGDTIIVLEAMKMENDIVSPCDGQIKSLLVKKGDSVNSNDILAIVG